MSHFRYANNPLFTETCRFIFNRLKHLTRSALSKSEEMAASCCTATSTRLVASSSCQARKTRTLSLDPLRWNPHSPFSIGYNSTSVRFLSFRKVPTNALRPGVRSADSKTLAWIQNRRHSTSKIEDFQSRRNGSAILAYTLCFLFSASAASSENRTSAHQHKPYTYGTTSASGGGGGGGGGGGIGPRKATQLSFIFSQTKAEEDVQKTQEEALKTPYMVSEGLFQGARWTMEDTYIVANGGRFLAVFDGHGGAEVSSILQERLYELYVEALTKKHWEDQNEFGVKRKEIPSKSAHIAALQRGLEQIEEAVMKLDELVYQGSAAVCVVLHTSKDGRRTLLTANIGDSRAILCRGEKAVDMTRDHKPGEKREKERIEAMGEEIEWDPYGQVYRVRDLSLSRAVGDRFAKPIVSSEPEILTFPLEEESDRFVVLASDGLWDVMSSQDVVDYVQEVLDSNDEIYATVDKREYMARIIANEALERGSADNVCVLVLWLDKND